MVPPCCAGRRRRRCGRRAGQPGSRRPHGRAAPPPPGGPRAAPAGAAETSGWLIPSRSTSSCTNRGWSASSVTIASRAGAASTFSSSPAASNAFVWADTDTHLYKHMLIRLCKAWRLPVPAGRPRARPARSGPARGRHPPHLVQLQ